MTFLFIRFRQRTTSNSVSSDRTAPPQYASTTPLSMRLLVHTNIQRQRRLRVSCLNMFLRRRLRLPDMSLVSTEHLSIQRPPAPPRAPLLRSVLLLCFILRVKTHSARLAALRCLQFVVLALQLWCPSISKQCHLLIVSPTPTSVLRLSKNLHLPMCRCRQRGTSHRRRLHNSAARSMPFSPYQTPLIRP